MCDGKPGAVDAASALSGFSFQPEAAGEIEL
jgi:hypothetical protein